LELSSVENANMTSDYFRERHRHAHV